MADESEAAESCVMILAADKVRKLTLLVLDERLD